MAFRGPAPSPSGRLPDAFRLCFASPSPERTEVGVRRLVRALDPAREEHDRPPREDRPGPPRG